MPSFGLPKQKQHGKKNDKCEFQNRAFRTSEDRKTDTKPATANGIDIDEHLETFPSRLQNTSTSQSNLCYLSLLLHKRHDMMNHIERSLHEIIGSLCTYRLYMQTEMLHAFQEWVENQPTLSTRDISGRVRRLPKYLLQPVKPAIDFPDIWNRISEQVCINRSINGFCAVFVTSLALFA